MNVQSALRRLPPGVITVALIYLAAIIVLAVIGNVFTPYRYVDQHLLTRLKPPAFLGGDPHFPLGTDRLGRDLVARLVFGLRVSILVALAGSIIGSSVGITLGIVAAHFRGWAEEAIMMIVDFQASLPFILVALTLLAFFGNSLGLLIVLMGLYGWDTYARLTRGIVLSALGQPYVQALRSLGAGPLRLYLRHILPNIMGVLIVQMTINFLQIILLEAALSFLGLGVQAPMTSLGQILGDGRDYLSSAWWITILPGIIIVATTLSMSLVGDWLRDRLDPTLSGQHSN